MGAGISTASDAAASVRVSNRGGASPYVVICDHASNFMPAEFADLGLEKSDLARHIAWDPGALPVARRLAEALDAVLVESCISRLIIDCNRPLDAPDLISEASETTIIPGNSNLSADDRQARIALSWAPFHEAVDAVIAERLQKGSETRLVSVHSFTPRYKGIDRPWQIGVIHDEDDRLAGPMISALKGVVGLNVGVNQPYSPADLVYYSLERHGRSRGLACAMIEIRNDEIANGAGQRKWADLLAAILAGVQPAECAGVERV
ncbi:N-formylglutamate amidohydrolase [Pseudaminobacter sp. NGMCC 1.201702]|uniref:N-formylglutamate amidohydrolase n=1 Tax=Pseudaminobacter sp. NGMCC 1.201702 TaxID=3391825 RepID=UPI0039EEFC09